MHNHRVFPFSAIVGQQAMKLALILNAIHPAIGGVLIVGARGSAKSTAARSLAALLPSIRSREGCHMACDPEQPADCCPVCSRITGEAEVEPPICERPTPFVSLPLGATEDRVTGTIDLEQALTRGRARFEPGVLAKAHRGVLYIDEVNLLPDHLVDLLLDVAATGVHHVEREGISVTHPARFILVGTMNPEEGELRPQILDRFGLWVGVEEFPDGSQRGEVVRRVLAFETDPESFCSQWKAAEEEIRLRLEQARQRLAQIVVPQSLSRCITDLCCRARVEGLRADLVIHKAASALAAWEGRSQVNESDVVQAAELALPHRRRELPEPPPPTRRKPPSSAREQQPGDGSRGEGPTSEPSPPEDPVLLKLPSPIEAARPLQRGTTTTQSRGKKRTRQVQSGPTIRAIVPRGSMQGLAFVATLRAAARRFTGLQQRGPRLAIRPTDVRVHDRRGPDDRLFLFIVDASGSMGARGRLAAAKGALLGLLESAYRKRERVALIACAGSRPTLVVAPTRSARVAQRRLYLLPAGGRTPLAAGLELAERIADRERRRCPELAVSVIVLSDGHPNVPHRGLDPIAAVERQLESLIRKEVGLLLVDAEESTVPLALMSKWATRSGLPYLKLGEVNGRRLPDAIRTSLQAPGISLWNGRRDITTQAASCSGF